MRKKHKAVISTAVRKTERIPFSPKTKRKMMTTAYIADHNKLIDVSSTFFSITIIIFFILPAGRRTVIKKDNITLQYSRIEKYIPEVYYERPF